MVCQLRVYAVKPGAMDQFLSEWTESVVPLRRAYGFAVLGAWCSRGDDTFVWMLGHDGPGSFEEASAAYYDSEQRRKLPVDPARLIDSVQTTMLTPVPVPAGPDRQLY